jgi:hypothetical protein
MSNPKTNLSFLSFQDWVPHRKKEKIGCLFFLHIKRSNLINVQCIISSSPRSQDFLDNLHRNPKIASKVHFLFFSLPSPPSPLHPRKNKFYNEDKFATLKRSKCNGKQREVVKILSLCFFSRVMVLAFFASNEDNTGVARWFI